MRIAMIAPIWETVPPTAYGGIELVVDLLARYLVEAGHQVTLFATGDSTCPVERQSTEPVSLRARGFDTWSCHMAEAIHLSCAYTQHDRFDLYHNNAGPLGNAFASACPVPTLTTLHGPILPANERYFTAFGDHPYVSISDAQRAGSPELNYVSTIYHGIETDHFAVAPKQGYLLFLGRISPEKGAHLAIEAALAADIPLVMAAKIDPFDREYFEARIAPHIDGSRVRFLGEVAGERKYEVLRGASAMLHLVQWEEPFGLAMIEAFASGTPVIAMPHGSIPELVAHGRTGFVVRSVAQAVEAIAQLDRIDPMACRAEAVARFDVRRMVADYVDLYAQLTEKTDRTFARGAE